MSKTQIKNKKTINKIVKAINNTKDKMVKKAAEQAHNCFEESVGDFYESYTPHHKNIKYYRDRTYSLYKAIGPVQRFQTGNKFVIRKRVHPGYIPGNPYRADKDWVFSRSLYGKSIEELNDSIHGFTPDEADKWGRPDYINRFGEPSKWRLPPSSAPSVRDNFNLYQRINTKWNKWKQDEASKYMRDILLNELKNI